MVYSSEHTVTVVQKIKCSHGLDVLKVMNATSFVLVGKGAEEIALLQFTMVGLKISCLGCAISYALTLNAKLHAQKVAER